jgi:hypothetical protein
MRKRWIQNREGKLVPIEEEQNEQIPRGIAIIPDTPDFVSPIDGSIVSGRSGMREHCRIHGVVPTQELAGLPPLHSVTPWKHTEAEKREIRERLIYEYDNGRRKRT